MSHDHLGHAYCSPACRYNALGIMEFRRPPTRAGWEYRIPMLTALGPEQSAWLPWTPASESLAESLSGQRGIALGSAPRMWPDVRTDSIPPEMELGAGPTAVEVWNA